MVALGAEHLQQRDGGGNGLDALAGSVRHIDDSDTRAADRVNSGAFGNEIQNHLIIATRRRIVHRRVSTRGGSRELVLLLLLILLLVLLLLALLISLHQITARTGRAIVRGVDVRIQFLDQVLHRSQPARRSRNIVVAVRAGS